MKGHAGYIDVRMWRYQDVDIVTIKTGEGGGSDQNCDHSWNI